jgi:dipeptidyl aminopeptidase/acylaminoacyl peptidase
MEIPLIPRRVLFGNPDKTLVRISPDGAHIAYLAPRDGVLNIWVAPRDDLAAARPVTADKGRGIRFYLWAYTGQQLLYIQDKNGDENWRVYATDLQSEATKDLTPFEGVQAQILAVEPKYPQEIIIAINNRDAQYHDIYRVNLVSGERRLLEQNDGYADFSINNDYRVVGAMRMTPDGGAQLFQKKADGWQPWDTIGQEDLLTTAIIGYNQDNTRLYMRDSRGRDTSALVQINLETDETRLIAEHPQADQSDVMIHPLEKTIQAVAFTYLRKEWQVFDPAIQADLDYLRAVADGEVEITGRSVRGEEYWTVAYVLDDRPVQYYLYDRQKKCARYLFANREDLANYPLAKMHPVVIPSRDGLNLTAYYTLPVGSDSDDDGIPDQPLPMVFTPHGGPWTRDFWGFHIWHQWLSNRGYAVLNVNFRGSTGLGKAFTNAGDREWGGKIMEDQMDAVQWAMQQGIAAADKVAVMGASFGGYSALAGLTLYPDVFACGVDLVGISNLATQLESLPPYYKPMLELFTTRIGDHRTEEGRALLKKHSPLTYADRIIRPLLIGQGANDPRVKQAESDQIVKAMQEKQIPVTYALYSDEGHGLRRPENNLSFHAIAEAFLARCLGGRYEPIGSDFTDSSLQVLTGAQEVPGLSAALEK